MLQANVGEELTTAEIEKILYKYLHSKGLIWTPSSYLDNIPPRKNTFTKATSFHKSRGNS